MTSVSKRQAFERHASKGVVDVNVPFMSNADVVAAMSGPVAQLCGVDLKFKDDTLKNMRRRRLFKPYVKSEGRNELYSVLDVMRLATMYHESAAFGIPLEVASEIGKAAVEAFKAEDPVNIRFPTTQDALIFVYRSGEEFLIQSPPVNVELALYIPSCHLVNWKEMWSTALHISTETWWSKAAKLGIPGSRERLESATAEIKQVREYLENKRSHAKEEKAKS